MTAEKLIKILKQFDPEDRVVIDAGGAILDPDDIVPVGDVIVVNAYSPQYKATLPATNY